MIGVKGFIGSHLCEKLVAKMPHKVGVEELISVERLGHTLTGSDQSIGHDKFFTMPAKQMFFLLLINIK